MLAHRCIKASCWQLLFRYLGHANQTSACHFHFLTAFAFLYRESFAWLDGIDTNILHLRWIQVPIERHRVAKCLLMLTSGFTGEKAASMGTFWRHELPFLIKVLHIKALRVVVHVED